MTIVAHSAAVKAVADRLLQMRQLWEDAARNYFEPSRFLLDLQNCITVSRSVTFILQAQKRVVDDFDKWYEPHRARMASDPVMVWAREARNSIEKQGDLKTLSQVRAEIIASYYDGVITGWMPQALFASPKEIFRGVPDALRIPHIVENGTLVIERRWIDEELPEIEVLEAMAHVYGQLADTVVDLFRYLGFDVPVEITETRPDPMGALAMDRAMYLSMRDGSASGFRIFKKEMSVDEKFLRKRYGKNAMKWKKIKNAANFREFVEAYFRMARMLMATDGYHRSFAFLLKGIEVIEIVGTEHPDRASRYVLMRDLARLGHIVEADGVMLIHEAWTAKAEDTPSGFAADAKNRGETLVLVAANATCESFGLSARIVRKKSNTQKVKRLEATVVEENPTMWILYPFQREWGCVEPQKMFDAIKSLEEQGVRMPQTEAGQSEVASSNVV